MKASSSPSSFDVVILGGGSAGYAAARTAAGLGVKVAVIDGAKDLGGLCILRGCMPTKALLESAHRWNEIKRAGEFGLRVKPLAPDLKAILKRKDQLIAGFADYRVGQLEKGKFTLIRGMARFVDPRTVEVNGKKITGKAFIIATGSVVASVPVPGLEETGYLTSDDALKLAPLPKSLIVLGAGAVGVEFAQFYAHLGTKVTVLQRSPQILKSFDADTAAEVERAFRDGGIDLRTGTKLLSVAKKGTKTEVRFEQDGKKARVTADLLLNALGRRPALASLNLPAAGIPLGEGGKIAVDAKRGLRTKAAHIFAAGDAAGLHEVVHSAIAQGEIAAKNAAVLALGSKKTLPYADPIPLEIVFTEPEAARAGMTEKEARAKGIDCLVASYPFNDHGKANIMGAEHGVVKLVADRKGKLLGGQYVGPHASDLIHELVPLLHFGATAAELAAMPHYHPTLAEIITYPAEEIADMVQAAAAKVKKVG
ncbi:Pyruvate/2-oxoglutarate dehydrogenase complex, dihydrolipoamide dehydrogenase (E3) component [Verrucomicrobium sp. GAS474]|uniref:dihydrolipoyl dehydrogenase family protein n=1 Tax=Verrucomicrobium sp. GAS474 TaxID=1882831 RepID=UPI00087A8A9C|nr:dihydrolipoyl dehydrogenase [Verrucomicrobium sp. GAS474]SDT89222.1 Pyruvate/2-oxoglutarate dehydrogenase complex, dihydrolipoamide dehydrogenase (E3) component [Verrucomicrobium sp. GAS474]